MKSIQVRLGMLLLLLAGASLLAGCAPQPGTLTLENYEKLKFGMSYDSVVAILGKPQQVHPFMGIQQCTWVRGERHIHAKFMFKRAVYYSSKGLQPKLQDVTRKSAGG